MNDQRPYRGITKETGEWMKGCLCVWQGRPYISSKPRGSGYESDKHCNVSMDGFDVVIPETVGQSTGLKDKNATEIFDGDKWRQFVTDQKTYPGQFNDFVVYWDGYYAAFYIKRLCDNTPFPCHSHPNDGMQKGEVIGTIHDHLLKGESHD